MNPSTALRAKAAAGIDVGARSTKAVVLVDGVIRGKAEVVSGEGGEAAARQALEEALTEAGLGWDDLGFAVATGVGRAAVAFARKQSSEVACQARGARYLFPEAGGVINLGAESSRALRLNEQGKVEGFSTHEKCAAGSGLFLETVARIMEVSLEEMGELALAAPQAEEVASHCAVFAESDVISHIHRGLPREVILAGVHQAVADRLLEVAQHVRPRPPVVMTGRPARNQALVREMEKRLGLPILVPEAPELVGALGAALLAQEAVGSTPA